MTDDEDAPSPFRKASGAALALLGGLAALWGWRALLTAGWGFDVLDGAHWAYLRQLGAAWWRGAGRLPDLDFAAVLALGPPAAWLLAKRLRRGIERDHPAVAFPLFLLRLLAGPAAWLWRLARESRPAGRPERILDPARRPAPVAGPAGVAEEAPAAPEDAEAPGTPTRRAGAGLNYGEDLPPEPEATRETNNRPEATGTPGDHLEAPGKGGDSPGDEEQPAEEIMDISDLTATTLRWLKDNGWDCVPDLRVDGDRGQLSFQGDQFDNDPAAVVHIAAFSAAEIWLLRLVDLRGLAWEAAAADDSRPGIPAWYPVSSVDGTADDGAAPIDCPFSMALRARERFLAHHGAFLDFESYSPAAINAAVICAGGEIANLADVGPGWEQRSVSLVVLAANQAPLVSLFGEPVDPADTNAEVVAHIGRESGAIEKARRAA